MTIPQDMHFALCPWWNGGKCDCEQVAEELLEDD